MGAGSVKDCWYWPDWKPFQWTVAPCGICTLVCHFSVSIGARHRNLENEAIRRLEQVGGNSTAIEHIAGDEAVLEEAVHRVAQRNNFIEWIVTSQVICHCFTPSFPRIL